MVRAVAWFMYRKKYFLLQFRQGILIIKMYSHRENRKRGKGRKSFPCVEPFSQPDWYIIMTDKEEESDDYA